MVDLDERLRELREHTAPPLSDGDVDRLIAGGTRRRKLRRARRIGGGVVFAGVAAALALLTLSRLREPAALSFADGSTVALVDSHSEVSVTRSTLTSTEVAVRHGGGRFDVKRNPGRLFRVTAGPITVDVIGTRFTVTRDGDEVRVGVERGRVRVRSPRGDVVLGEGEASAFPEHGSGAPGAGKTVPLPELDDPPAAPEPAATTLPAPATPQAAPPATPPASEPRHAEPPSWRDSMKRHDFAGAYALMRKDPSAVHDAPDDLLQAADVARWSGHPAAAVPLLERVLKRYAADPRAQLAAFTLGRLYFDELHRPREADAAFARARALAPNGPLAEDALFHQIECADNSGDVKTARARAREYLQTYPTGSHVRSARRIGGAE